MANYYPIMLDVRERKALVIGGDRVAAEKAVGLTSSGAHVTVQAEAFDTDVRELAASGTVTLREKAYATGDLSGFFVVIAAVTYQPELAAAIAQEAHANGQLLNIVDVPDRCDFIMPSILRRGPLTIAVSTEGTNPSLAKRIRQQLETTFPPIYASYLNLATAARAHLRSAAISYDRRDAFFGEYAASPVLTQLIGNDREGAAQTTAELLNNYGVTVPVPVLREAVTADGAL